MSALSELLKKSTNNEKIPLNGPKLSLVEKSITKKQEKKHSISSLESCPGNLISSDAEIKSIGDPVVETSLAIRKMSQALG